MNDHLVVLVDSLSKLDERLLTGKARALTRELLFRGLLLGVFGMDVAANHQDAAAHECDDGKDAEAHNPEDNPDPGRCL
jgi:hypothetical protein